MRNGDRIKGKRDEEQSMTHASARVLWNRAVSGASFNMGITCGKAYGKALPGQFVMIGLKERLSPLLRRPFSIHRLNMRNGEVQSIEILYKVIGESTRLFSSLKEGDEISVLGPLGQGFSWKKPAQRIFLVGGGIGAAPLLFLAESLTAAGGDLSQSLGLIGGRTGEDVLCVKEMTALNLEVRISTDNGSLGKKGLITDLLTEAIAEKKPEMIYACGPHPMLKAVSVIAEKHGIACQISIETMMACGMGACLACAVPNRKDDQKYRHACLDGPVFDSREIRL